MSDSLAHTGTEAVSDIITIPHPCYFSVNLFLLFLKIKFETVVYKGIFLVRVSAISVIFSTVFIILGYLYCKEIRETEVMQRMDTSESD